MIGLAGPPAPPIPRLVEALARLGHAVRPSLERGPEEGSDAGLTLIVGPAGFGARAASSSLLAPGCGGCRILVIGWIGTHPDARVPGLRELWSLEERVRSSGLPAMTLRLAPLLGPKSPLWLRLRAQPRLPRGGRLLFNPVAEADVVETLDRALRGRARWEGWYEVAGPEMITLRDLASLARDAGPRLPADAGAWEPDARMLEAQRPADPRPWLEHFGIEAAAPSALARSWTA